MLKIVWFIGRPENNIDDEEAVYQDGHVRRGMRQENLRAFRINRAVLPQPPKIEEVNGLAVPPVFRFSEGYWDSFEDMEECYRSPNGLAALADGMLNGGPRVPISQPVLFASEEELPAESRIGFDFLRGRYSDPAPTKLFLFASVGESAQAEFDRRYREMAPAVGAVPGLGPHVFARTEKHVLQLGRARAWPAGDSDHYDRILEYYFPDLDSLTGFTESDAFGDVRRLLDECSDKSLGVAAEPQEVFFTTTGDQPLPQAWREV